MTRKHEKTAPQKLLIIDPDFFYCTGLAAQTAQKQKSCTTKSPLMQDWIFRLGSTIYNEVLLERIFDVPRCGFWYNTYQQIGSFSGTEDIIYKNVKFRQNMSGFGSALLKKMVINQPDLPLTPCNFSWIFHRESKSFNPEPWTQWDKSICEIVFLWTFIFPRYVTVKAYISAIKINR